MENYPESGYLFNSMKKKLYVETSVWNQLTHTDRPDWRDSAEKFFDTIKRGHYQAYISNVVIEEIMSTEKEKVRKELTKLINEISPQLLAFDDEAQALTEKYMASDFINSKSERVYRDSAHVAVATVNEIKHIITYNF